MSNRLTKDEWILSAFVGGEYIADIDNGIIYGNRFNKVKKIKPYLDIGGYEVVKLSINKVEFKCKVHRIIAIISLGISSDNLTVDHIDGNKRNNKSSNLQYLSRIDNLRKSKCRFSINDIINIKKHYLNGKYQYHIASIYKASQSTISDILNGSYDWMLEVNNG